MFQLNWAITKPLPKNRPEISEEHDMDLFFGRSQMIALWS
jgi:hypothetical protein